MSSSRFLLLLTYFIFLIEVESSPFDVEGTPGELNVPLVSCCRFA